MEHRVNIFSKGSEALKTLYGIGNYLNTSSIEKELQELVDLRVSQINGCIHCLDMHYKSARENGETEQRIYALNAWREASYYSERERAALALAEAVTKCEVSDNVYSAVKKQFSDQEIIDLTLAITSINTWNRINIVFTDVPESYNVTLT
tara:strand:+ start:32107 stop:32556 length:450 start_codon:yes stop_codon:yes gene_type:complete